VTADRSPGAAPVIDALLQLDTTIVRPGERLRYTIRNIGGAPILFGAAYAIERLDSDGWTPCPGPRWFPAAGYTLRPGDAREQSACVPATEPPGRHRLVKQVSFFWMSSPDHRRDRGARVPSLELSFEFDVS
jgi:hypothetical protein